MSACVAIAVWIEMVELPGSCLEAVAAAASPPNMWAWEGSGAFRVRGCLEGAPLVAAARTSPGVRRVRGGRWMAAFLRRGTAAMVA